MNRIEFLDLRFGHSRWMRTAQLCVYALCVAAILASPASLAWKIPAVFLASCCSAWHLVQSASRTRAGSLRLCTDGTALLQLKSGQEINSIAGAHGWISRWLSILTLQDSENGMQHYCVICASENHPDDYRRLLVFLRLHATAPDDQGMTW